VFKDGEGEHLIECAIFKVDGMCILLADAFGEKLGQGGVGDGIDGKIEGLLVHT
jgi:hypothetical protein